MTFNIAPAKNHCRCVLKSLVVNGKCVVCYTPVPEVAVVRA